MEKKLNIRKFKLFFPVVILLLCSTGYAGNVDPDNDGSRYAWAENAGWVNLEPSFGPGVTVTNLAVEGFAWGENIGWVNLSPVNGGVVNDGNGNLSGYAWGENTGWISFSCSNTNTCATVEYGVSVDPATGEFDGFAWGENIGWIKFRSTGAVPYGVTTSWRDDSDGGDGGVSGGGGGCGTLTPPGGGGGFAGPLMVLGLGLWAMRRWWLAKAM